MIQQSPLPTILGYEPDTSFCGLGVLPTWQGQFDRLMKF